MHFSNTVLWKHVHRASLQARVVNDSHAHKPAPQNSISWLNWRLRRWLSGVRLAVSVCCSSSKLTGRGSPLFHGSRLCRCRAENRLQTRWWRSPRHHSSLNKNTGKRTRDKVTFIHYSVDYYEQVSLFDCSLISPFFPCNSFANLALPRPFSFRLFLLSTFRKSVISFFVLAPIHHHSRCHSIRGSFVEITKLGCFIEGCAFRLRRKSRVNKAFCLLLSGVWLKKKKKKNVLFLLMLHFWKISLFDWHEAQVCILGRPA